MSVEQNFKFWVPATIEKGIPDKKTGKTAWKFKGIASTADTDTDGENLIPQGFDLSYFLSDGFVNWNHQSKNNPAAIIGEPTFAEIRPEGMYVETELYQNSKVAESVWELGQVLDKSSKTRKLGFSIEGKVLQKDPMDPKRITKAKITGLAITPSPKNKQTFADIIKGDISDAAWEYEDAQVTENDLSIEKGLVIDITGENGDRIMVDKSLNINIIKGEVEKVKEEEEEEDEKEKSLDTVAGMPITPSNFSNQNPHFKPDTENLKNISSENFASEKKNINLKEKFTKSDVYEKIFSEITTDIEKANLIYSLVEKIEQKTNKEMIKKISLDSIQKAFDSLGLNKSMDSDSSPAVADGNSSMEGPTDGLSLDNVMGMYKGMDGCSTKQEYLTKAISKGVKKEVAEEALEKAVKSKMISVSDNDGDEDEDLKKAEEEMNSAKEKFESLKSKGKQKVEEKTEKVDNAKEEKLEKALTETLTVLKSLAESNNSLQSKIEEQNDTFSKALEDTQLELRETKRLLDKTLSEPVGRRSVATSNYLEKGNASNEMHSDNFDGVVLNLSDKHDSKEFMARLEEKTFEKGQLNQFYGNIMSQCELGRDYAIATLKTKGVLQRIEKELNIRVHTGDN